MSLPLNTSSSREQKQWAGDAQTTSHSPPANTEAVAGNKDTGHHGDASALFGDAHGHTTDLFFSSIVPAEASFFDNVSAPATVVTTEESTQRDGVQTHAYDAQYEYSGQETAQTAQTAQNGSLQQQYYDPSQQQQWIAFDPNTHYYYDEQGQLHFYDPNTNQDIDYQYTETSQEYQYDPQYAQYYEQNYDPSAYTTTVEQPMHEQSAETLQYVPTTETEVVQPSTTHYETTYAYDTQEYGQGQEQRQEQEQKYDVYGSTAVSHLTHPSLSLEAEAAKIGEIMGPWDSVSVPQQRGLTEPAQYYAQEDVSDQQVAQVSVIEEEDKLKGSLAMKKTDSEPINLFQNEVAASDGYVSVHQNETEHSTHEKPIHASVDSGIEKENENEQHSPDPVQSMTSIPLFSGEVSTHYEQSPSYQEKVHYNEQSYTTNQDQTVPIYGDITESETSNWYGQEVGYDSLSGHAGEESFAHPSTAEDPSTGSRPDTSYLSDNHSQEKPSEKTMVDDLDDLILGEKAVTSTTDVYTHSTEATTDTYAMPSYQPQVQQDKQNYTLQPTPHETIDQTVPYPSSSYEPQLQVDYAPEPTTYSNTTPHYADEQTSLYGMETSYEKKSYSPYDPQDSSPQYDTPTDYSAQYNTPKDYSTQYDTQNTTQPTQREFQENQYLPKASSQEDTLNNNYSGAYNNKHPPSTANRNSMPANAQEPYASFEGYAYSPVERSSTVPPPPMTRMVTPQPDTLQSCPNPACEGENKAKAKFCCECGRPLAGISRSTTPAATATLMMAMTPAANNALAFQPYYPPRMDAQEYGALALASAPASDPKGYSSDRAVFSSAVDSSPYPSDYNEPTAPEHVYGGDIPQHHLQPLTADPLNRAGGYPLISFGFGGKMCVMFPHTVQRFTSGYDNSGLITKKMPNAITIKNLGEVLGQDPAVQSMSDFVGPILLDSKMSAKAKKKEALVYMEKRVSEFEAALNKGPVENQNGLENKIVLWKLVKTLMEQEGTVGDNDKVDTAIRDMLQLVGSGGGDEEDSSNFSVPAYEQTLSTAHGNSNGGNATAMMTASVAGEVDYSDSVLDKLQKYLIKGDREGAVEYAVQEDMWAHALIISSCVNKELWKKVTNHFIERELCATPESKQTRVYHNVMGNKQALRVLYALFAGSGAASISEFAKSSEHHLTVPYGGAPNTTLPIGLEKLKQWQETLLLILANRTPRDYEAITALGDLLKAQRWIEAAHICYILSPQSSLHSGIDAPHVRLTLLGTDGHTISRDLDALYLSELYEFAMSNKQTITTSMPFLQPYKLAYAWQLVDYGLTGHAQRYCEAIAGAIKANTKRNPWMHRQFVERLEEFSEHCEVASGHSLGGDAGSWLKTKLAKNSLDSLWGSLEGRFNKFVSGEDMSPAEPVGRKSTEIMADGVSVRSPFSMDQRNGGYGGAGSEHVRRSGTPSSAMGVDGYAIERQMTSSPYSRVPSGFEPARNATQSPSFNGQDRVQTETSHAYRGYGGSYGYSQDSVAPPTANYSPFQHSSGTPIPPQNAYGYNNHSNASHQSNGGNGGGWWSGEATTDQPQEETVQSGDHQHPQFSYTASSYEPTSYEPDTNSTPTWGGANDNDDLGFGNSKPKKTDTATPQTPVENTATVSQAESEMNDASLDGKQEKQGWGIFSLFSRSSAPVASKEDKKAVKANLGEQNQFYYDEKEKRWVNRSADTKPATTSLPPPPKSVSLDSSRVSSPAMPPPPSTPSLMSNTPPVAAPPRMNSAPISATASPPIGSPSVGSPSMSTPPPPMAGKRASAVGGRKPMRSRYVDVFNQAPPS